MKRYYFFLMMWMAGILFSTLQAQELLVYSVTGTAKVVKGKSSSVILPRQKLTKETIVNLGTGARLILIDQEAKKQYTLSATGTYSIDKLIAKSQKSIKDLSDMYLSYLMKQINGKGVLTSKTAIDDTFASIERKANDSIMADSISSSLDTLRYTIISDDIIR